MDVSLLAQMLGHVPAPTSEEPDYSLADYEKKNGVPAPYVSLVEYIKNGNHLNDQFKIPNHITYSDQSAYSGADMKGGTWQSGGQNLYNFQPSQFNLTQHPIEQLIEYFKNRERRGTFITTPSGKTYEGIK
jgi:hypothetical protein